jgi:hypothetical protein
LLGVGVGVGVGVTVIPLLLTPLFPKTTLEVTNVFHCIEGVGFKVVFPPPPGGDKQIPREFKKLLTAGMQAAQEQIYSKQLVLHK